MFRSITEESEPIPNKKPSKQLLEILKHHWDLGNQKWQQPYNTQYHNNFYSKPVSAILKDQSIAI